MTIARADRLAQELADLTEAPREVLVERWRAVYGRPPTRGTRRELLVASAAWHLQAKRLGGLSREAKRRLARETAKAAALKVGPETGEKISEASAVGGPLSPSSVLVAPLTAGRGAIMTDLVLLNEHDFQATGATVIDPGDAIDDAPRSPIAQTARILPVDQPAPVPPRSPADRRTILPGARLLRDWNGVTHAVDVVEGGYLYDGRVHRSLSAIAKAITGAHWSGPRFFGL